MLRKDDGWVTLYLDDGETPLNPAVYFPGNSDANAKCFTQGYTFTTTNAATGAPAPNTVCSNTTNQDRRRIFSLIDFDKTGQFVGPLAEYQSVGKLSYGGMLLDVRKRTSHGLTLGTNYTWSHCLSSDQDTLNGNLYDSNSTYIYLNNRDRGITNCTSDRRHILNMTGVAQMPTFQNKTLRLAASGWKLAPIYRIQSGSWMSIIAGAGIDTARNATAAAGQPADQLLDNIYGDTSGRPLTNWFNISGCSAVLTAAPTDASKCAFHQPTIGTLGNMKPRTARGPKFWSFDVALSREFRFMERQSLDFRVEAYNLTNSLRMQNPSASQNNALFGQLRTSYDPRILQFALKYGF